MQSTEIRFVVLFLILYNGEVKSNECAENQNNTLVGRTIKRDSDKFPEIKKKIDKLFDAFDKNDDKRLKELYDELENVEINDEEHDEDVEYESGVIKYVVREKKYMVKL